MKKLDAMVDKLRQAVGIGTHERQRPVRITSQVSSALAEPIADRAVRQAAWDLFESEAAWLVRADVPGARADNTEVTWDDAGRLSVRVLRSDPAVQGPLLVGAPQAEDWVCQVPLPGEPDLERASSALHLGVLTITVPKAHTAKSLPIAIDGRA